jgi:large subunit ribosomal protein L23
MINTLIKPIITEKSMMAASRGIYTFGVLLTATKSQIKEAVQTAFKVNVTRVNTSLRHVSAKSTGSKRIMGVEGRAKYATVTLKKGQTIELFDLKEEK